jgi:transcriptional regulator with XRE-family HTH domain
MRGITDHMTAGERIALYRKRRGMSQEVLAGLVGRTADWLSKVENIRHDLDRLSVLRSVADALDVTIGDLLAEPTLMDWSGESGNRTVPALREALMDYRQITPLFGAADVEDPPQLDSLRADVGLVWDAYQDSRYGLVTRQVPLVLADALLASRGYNGEEGPVVSVSRPHPHQARRS